MLLLVASCLCLCPCSYLLLTSVSLFNAAKVSKGFKKHKKAKKGLKKLKRHDNRTGEVWCLSEGEEDECDPDRGQRELEARLSIFI